MTVRLPHPRLTLLTLVSLLLVLAACDSASNAPPTTPIAPATVPAATVPAATEGTATPRVALPDLGTPGATLPASQPTTGTDALPPTPQQTGSAGQVAQPQLTGPAGQVPRPQPTGSPVYITPGAVDPDEPPRVSIQELQQLLTQPDTLLVDVRSKGNFEERHIKGAVSYPFTTIDTHIQDVPKDKLIIAYCQ